MAHHNLAIAQPRPVSVRDQVRAIQIEVRERPDLSPARACELLALLTSLLGNCNTEVTDAEIAFNEVLLQHLDAEAKANRARIRAETSQEYRRKREARDTHALVSELIISLRHIVRMQEQELRLAR